MQSPELDAIGREPIPPPDLPPDNQTKKELDYYAGAKIRLHRAFHSGIVWIVRATTGVVIAVGLIGAFHMVAPMCWRWLTEEQLKDLKEFLVSGIIGGAITKSVSKIGPVGGADEGD
jgi:hypothetical protein